MSAPHMSPDKLAQTRVQLAGEVLAAKSKLAELVERHRLAGEKASEIGQAATVVRERRGLVQDEINRALGIVATADGDPPARDLAVLVEELNEIDEVRAAVARDEHRAAAELGTAQSLRTQEAERFETLRGRLQRLLEP